jgi:hypothetical protein
MHVDVADVVTVELRLAQGGLNGMREDVRSWSPVT